MPRNTDQNQQARAAARRRSVRTELGLQQINPLRPTAWRWELAGKLVEQGLAAPPRSQDALLHDAVKFRRRFERLQASGRLHSFTERSAVRQAYEVFAIEDMRFRLEARLLTGASFESIAGRLDLPVATVEAFEGLFFCVQKHLKARDWIMKHAVGLAHRHELNPIAVVKAFAYFGGPLVLEAVLAAEFDGFRSVDIGLLGTPAGRNRCRAQLAVFAAAAPAENLDLLREINRIAGVIRQLDAQYDASCAARAASAQLADELLAAKTSDPPSSVPGEAAAATEPPAPDCGSGQDTAAQDDSEAA